MIDKNINEECNQKWNQLLTNLKPGDKSFWRVSRSLRGTGKNKIPNINIGNTKVTSDIEKTDILANAFSQANKLTLNLKAYVKM